MSSAKTGAPTDAFSVSHRFVVSGLREPLATGRITQTILVAY